ncbi:GAF and ANTAR domain-containing protein [Mycobacterium kyogaense]|uniref:GAF and ANTAR domain-containing protein n=1 Tax=Mycobacterium kyogaense TaxID=2212479 RepID=UPI000DAEC6E3|nr:GAF and ANTAR domain-containing protein [Mycobacterium kyogaense]
MTAPQSQPDMELAGIFASLAGVLLTETTVASALATLTSVAADTIGGSAGAGLTVLDAQGRRITSAATDPIVGQLDDLQYQLDEGPCLTAWRESRVVRTEPDTDEQRWPSWIRAARALGMQSFLSAALVVGERPLGAIKVYSTTVDAYSDRDADLLRRFARQAAIFVSNALTVQAAEQMSDTLKNTMRDRDVVAMARGILMARNRIGQDEAFRRLVVESHGSRRVLTQVAERVVASATEG